MLSISPGVNSPQAESIIRINDLQFTAPLECGSVWPNDSPQSAPKLVEQPFSLTLSIYYDIFDAAKGDDLSKSLNYAQVAKKVRGAVKELSEGGTCVKSVQHLAFWIGRALGQILTQFSITSSTLTGLRAQIHLVQLRPPLHTDHLSIGYIVTYAADGAFKALTDVSLEIRGLAKDVIVGVNEVERVDEQRIVVDLKFEVGQSDFEDEWVDIYDLVRSLYKAISKTDYQTLEALTWFIVNHILDDPAIHFKNPPTLTVRVAKPCALVFASSPQVEIRHRRSTSIASGLGHSKPSLEGYNVAAIAFGSNLGDTFQNIEWALRMLEDPSSLMNKDELGIDNPYLAVVDTSFLYDTKPMYVIDQPSFVNGACLIETNIQPANLLKVLKAIEQKLGRGPSERNTARPIDLDIIFYDREVLDTRLDEGGSGDKPVHADGVLVIPHPYACEREFVLRPLCDMIPDYVHPVAEKPLHVLLQDVTQSDPSSAMSKLIPFPMHLTSESTIDTTPPRTQCVWNHSQNNTHKTRIMGTLNVTPDSFSDGGDNLSISSALGYIDDSFMKGADMVDIGGCSTRPGAGAAAVSVDEEIRRVKNVLDVLRERGGDGAEKLISIDSFRPDVVHEAIKAGARCINDVYAFSGSPEDDGEYDEEEMRRKMKAIVRQYMTPVILMHSRGDAAQNKEYTTQYGYAAHPVVEGIRIELGDKFDKIVKGPGGVRRWLVIADPGVGFSKTLEGNLEVLRNAGDVVADVEVGDVKRRYRNPLRGFPSLIGVSRKSFLGKILEREPAGRETMPKERTFATAAAVVCAVQKGALIVRVHDVQEMMDIVKVAEAIHRP